MTRGKRLIPLILLGFCALPAHATSDLLCTVDDANLGVVLQATANRGHGTIMGIPAGEIRVKNAAARRIGANLPVTLAEVVQQP